MQDETRGTNQLPQSDYIKKPEEDQPKREESPSRASSSFFSSFFSSFAGAEAPPEGVAPPAAGAAEATATGAALKASSMLTSPSAATRALTLTSSGVVPVALTTLFTLSSVIFCFNLWSSNAA